MVIKYNDPYGNRKYAQLKGDKSDSYFKITFSEAVIYKTDEAYILFGQVDGYEGVVRSFKPENPITPGLCIVPFYGQEYEVRKKDKDGNWSSEKIEPSIFEKCVFKLIQENEELYIPFTASIKGSITHVPDSMLASQDEASREKFVENNVSVDQIDSTGKIPEYTPPVSGGQRKSYGGYSKGASMEEKLLFVKKEIAQTMNDEDLASSKSLGNLVYQFNNRYSEDEEYTQLYFDLLASIIK